MKQNSLGGQKFGLEEKKPDQVQRERQVWVCLNEMLSWCYWQLRSGDNLADLSQVGKKGARTSYPCVNPAIGYFPPREGGTAVEEAALFCWDHDCSWWASQGRLASWADNMCRLRYPVLTVPHTWFNSPLSPL